jgi:hypothetical protein
LMVAAVWFWRRRVIPMMQKCFIDELAYQAIDFWAANWIKLSPPLREKSTLHSIALGIRSAAALPVIDGYHYRHTVQSMLLRAERASASFMPLQPLPHRQKPLPLSCKQFQSLKLLYQRDVVALEQNLACAR